MGENSRLAARVPPTAAIGADGQRQRLALDGIKVLDASNLLAGPTTTRILAQYGAEVIKIEKAGVASGDVDPMTDDLSYLLAHRTINAGKRMIFLDVKQKKSRAVTKRLLETADVVHHNFTPDGAARLGFAPDQIREARPDAVLSTMTLHSVGGYRERYRGHEELAQAITGIFVRAGGNGLPRPTAILLNDHGSGHLAAFGILLALLHRYRTGETQEVNMSLSRMATMNQLPFMVAFEGRVWDEPAGTGALGWGAFDRLYQGSDGWFYLACPSPDFRKRLQSVEGLAAASTIVGAELETWLSERFSTRTVTEWVDALTAAGIAAHRYVDMVEVVRDSLSFALQATVVQDHPGLGKALGAAHPTWGNGYRGETLLAARRPGMDTLPILKELGFDASEILDLLRARTIALGENPVVTTTNMPGYWNRPENILTLASQKSLRQSLTSLWAELVDKPIVADKVGLTSSTPVFVAGGYDDRGDYARW